MIGAQNARMLVKNQCRTKTTMSVFFVSVHVCEKMAIVAWYAPVGGQRSLQSRASVYIDNYVQYSDNGAQDQRGKTKRMIQEGEQSDDEATKQTRECVKAKHGGRKTISTAVFRVRNSCRRRL